jgi:branched-subunit amino acid aminotransferase/4-amino-4-deoxychorismate lyase
MDHARDLSMIGDDPGFRITTSLLWLPGADLYTDSLNSLSLKHHQIRLIRSAEAFNFPAAFHSHSLYHEGTLAGLQASITAYLSTIAPEPTAPLKVTLYVSATGVVDIASTPATPPLYPFAFAVTPPPATNLTATIHRSPTPISVSLFTRHKTNCRELYDTIRAELSISNLPPTTTEVLLHNTSGQVTEASLSTVYLWRKGQWVTPAAECGGNLGVTRTLALEKGWCVEGLVNIRDVQMGEVVALSNGVRGFWFAVVI